MFDTGNCRPPTQSEYVVLLVGAQILCLLLSLVGFGFYFFAPPEDPAAVELLRNFSTMVSVIGLLVWLGRWVIRRFVD